MGSALLLAAIAFALALAASRPANAEYGDIVINNYSDVAGVRDINMLKNTAKGMPAKGGNSALPDAEVKAAVDYMAGAAAQPSAIPTAGGNPNAFNRLHTPPGARNRSPLEDGIHDPANPGTRALQAPLQSFIGLTRSNAGNSVDWVAALGKKQIQPRWDAGKPGSTPSTIDLNIVREVKGSMPDVVYPHKQHTEWLECSNCHPAIFIPQKGANQISMASIMMGEKCGVCHGKVAFPVSECLLCHSKKKTGPAIAAAAGAKEAAK